MVAMWITSTSRSSGPRRVKRLDQFHRLGAAVVDVDALPDWTSASASSAWLMRAR